MCLTPPTEGFPWDDLRKILPRCQQMSKVPNGVETLPIILIAWVGCTNVTDDKRRTDDDISRSLKTDVHLAIPQRVEDWVDILHCSTGVLSVPKAVILVITNSHGGIWFCDLTCSQARYTIRPLRSQSVQRCRNAEIRLVYNTGLLLTVFKSLVILSTQINVRVYCNYSRPD